MARTMRKYGMNIITATQHLDVNGYVKSDRGCRGNAAAPLPAVWSAR